MITQLKLRMSNAYLIRGTCPVLVDTGLPHESKQIEAQLTHHGVALSELAAIMHTHVHADHVGSTAELLQGATIPTLYHAADQPIMQQANSGALQGIGLRGALLVPLLSGRSFPQFTATAFLFHGMRLETYGIPGTIHHLPGHTAGSVGLVLDSGEAIVGDVVMGGFLGGTLLPKRPNYHYFAENISQVRQSIAYLLTLPVHTLFVGHGGPLSVEAVRRKWRALAPST
jgi:glyoxylase-like metal-dependent hydrolase (beta-lactamase superfamily II)